ncbi:MAG: hypothetical protein ACI8Z9_001024 [Paraglaciecola sp.]|jgi:hypothetical protein
MSQTWNQPFIEQLSLNPYQNLDTLFALSQCAQWPNAQGLNELQGRVLERGVMQQTFVCQNELPETSAYYEQIIFEQGIIPTRSQSWHDLFNGLMWLQFPRTKTLLNQLHVSDIEQFGLSPRTHRRNNLTHFDECGVVLACSDPALLECLKNHQWQEVFIEQRSSWGRDIHPYIFGHANYELLLAPFIGLTGKWLAVEVEQDFAQHSLAEQSAQIDRLVQVKIIQEDTFSQPRPLLPLPLLGIPGWWDANRDKNFYANKDYFRPKRL